MVLGLFIITAIPTVTGICQAYSAQKNQEQRLKDEQRMRKFHIDVETEEDNARCKEVENGRLVLKQDRVWVGPPGVIAESDNGYVAAGFYIEYPDKEVGREFRLQSQMQERLMRSPARSRTDGFGESSIRQSTSPQLDLCR